MATLRIERVDALPEVLNARTLYMLKQSDDTVKFYVTDNNGSKAMPVVSGEDEIEPLLLIGAMNA